MDNENKNVIFLMKLHQCKEEFVDSIKKDLNIIENYEKAKDKYRKYRNIYFEITGEEPKKDFEFFIEKISRS